MNTSRRMNQVTLKEGQDPRMQDILIELSKRFHPIQRQTFYTHWPRRKKYCIGLQRVKLFSMGFEFP